MTTYLLDYDIKDGSKLPTLLVTSDGSEGFEIKNKAINDNRHYFSEKDNISIEEAQKVINKLINA